MWPKSRAEIGTIVLRRQDFSFKECGNAAHQPGDKNIQDFKFTRYWFVGFSVVGYVITNDLINF